VLAVVVVVVTLVVTAVVVMVVKLVMKLVTLVTFKMAAVMAVVKIMTKKNRLMTEGIKRHSETLLCLSKETSYDNKHLWESRWIKRLLQSRRGRQKKSRLFG